MKPLYLNVRNGSLEREEPSTEVNHVASEADSVLVTVLRDEGDSIQNSTELDVEVFHDFHLIRSSSIVHFTFVGLTRHPQSGMHTPQLSACGLL